MSTLLATIGEVSEEIFETVGTVCSTIVNNDLLLFTTGFLFVGGCIAIFGRLLSKG